MQLVLSLFLFIFFPFLSNSTVLEPVIILHLIDSQIRSVDRLDRTYHHFLYFAHEHSPSFPSLVILLEEGYHQNLDNPSESDRWIAAIDFAVGVLVEEEPGAIENMFNNHLFPSHPFRPYITYPFAVDDLKTDLGSYFKELEYKIFNLRLQEILQDPFYSPEIYSPSHVAFLNLLFDFGDLITWNTRENHKYHLAFLFRAAFIDFNFVINVIICANNGDRKDFEFLAENVFEKLFEKNKEHARLALKFAVNVRTSDFSHLSYSDCIREYGERQLIPMLPKYLATSLKNQSMTFPLLSQFKVVEHLKTSIKHDIFWIIYNEFYFEAFRFDSTDREHFWWSFIYSLVHKFDQIFLSRQIFPETSNQQLLLDLKAPILEAADTNFLFFEMKEVDLFRTVLINGHHGSVTLLLEYCVDDFSKIFPQKRQDWILRFVAYYASMETTNFLFSFGEFQFSLEAFNFFLSTCAAQGKSSFLLDFPKYLNDEILLKASSKGHFDVVKEILLVCKNSKKFSHDAIVQVATEAFHLDDFTFLYEILSLSNDLHLNLRSLPFLFELFSKNDLEICHLILDSEYFNDEETLEIVRQATYAAFTLQERQVLWSLLNETDLFFAPVVQGQILFGAISAAVPDLQFLRSIISNFGFSFSKEIRKQAISIALNSSNPTEIVPVLLEFPAMFAASESSMLLSALTAFKLDIYFDEIITALKDRLSPFIFNTLLLEACDHRKIDCIQTILTCSDPAIYPVQSKNNLLFLAVKEGNLNWVQFLINCGLKLSFGALRKASLLARNHQNIQKYLDKILKRNKSL